MDNKNHDQILALIKKCPLFSYFTDEDISYLLPLFKTIRIAQGEILLHQGDVSDNIYIVVSGSLVSVLNYGFDKQKIIGMINPAETVGELGIISGEPRSLTVKAVVDTELLQLSGEIFLQLCQENTYISLQVMKLLTSRLQNTISLISEYKRCNILVFFSDDKNNYLDDFFSELKNNTDKFPIKFLPTDIEDPIDILQFIQSNQDQHIYLIVFIKSYDANLFKFFFDNSAKFSLITRNKLPVDINKDTQLILIHIQQHIEQHLELILLHDNATIKPLNTQLWLQQAKFSFHHHIRIGDNLSYQRFLRFALSRAVGIVFGGGGMRGFAHMGMLKALHEKKIPIDMVGGTSVGAAAAACYALTQDYVQCAKLFEKMLLTAQQAVYLRNLTWPITSIFSGDPITSFVLNHFGDVQIEDLWLPFFCISANLSSNNEMIHEAGSLGVALRCSGAVPILSPPMVVAGQQFYDGGILNNLPVDIMRKLIGNENKIIACDVSRFVKDPTIYDFPPVISLKQSLLQKLKISPSQHTFPGFFENFFHAMLLGASSKTEMNGMLADILIRPDLSKFATFKSNKESMETLIEIGYQQTMAAIENLGN